MPLDKQPYQYYRDEDLLPAITGGSNEAFDELYKRYGEKMFGYFYRMLWKNKPLAEDNVQELFLKIIRNAGQFETGRSFSTWLYSIAHNMCKNEYRKEETKMKHARNKPKESHAANPARDLDLQRFKTAVFQCVQQLAEDKKSLFVLRFQENLSVPEISQVLGIPEGTVKSRLFYLLKEMKDALSPFKTIHLYP